MQIIEGAIEPLLIIEVYIYANHVKGLKGIDLDS